MNIRFGFFTTLALILNNKLTLGHVKRLSLAGSLIITSGSAHALLTTYDLSFETSGQSMWGAGTAFRKQESAFLGTQWTNKTAPFGGIAGGVSSIPNPLYALWVICPAFCGDAPSKTTSVDTRNGAELNVRSSGKVGLEFGYTIDSGSVDSTVKYSALAEIPDIAIRNTDVISLNTNSVFDTGSIATQSPKIDAYISAIMKLSGSVDARACANIPLVIGGCESGSFNLPSVNLDQRILSIDPNSLKVLDGVLPGDKPLAEVPLLNQSLTLEGGATVAPPAVGFKLTGPLGVTLASTLPPTPSVSVDLAEVEVQVPDIATSGTKSSNTAITSSGRDDLLSAQIDLDGAATLLGGLPPAGVNATLVDVAGFKIEANLDIIDVDAGPVMGITQDFELVPTLMASIAFSNPIQMMGMAGMQTGWTGKWEDLPDFTLLESTTFSPTFWIDAMLTNEFGIDLGLVGTIDILKLGATASAAGTNLLNIGPISLNGLLGLDNTLFETNKHTFSVFGKTFELGGFNTVMGDAFTIHVNAPEPSTILLIAIGLAALGVARRRNVSSALRESAH